MCNKSLIKKAAAIGGAACLSLTILLSPITTVPVHAAPPSNDVNSPQYDVIEWRWKIENGGVYRRLYNYAINAWIGEWEYVCPA